MKNSFRSILAPSIAPRGLAPLGLGLMTAVSAVIAWPQDAAADTRTVVGVDLAFNNSVEGDDTGDGAGVDVFFGPRIDLAILTLTTEIKGGYHDFGGDVDPTVYRGLVGGALGIGIIVRPSVFAHVGVGHLLFDAPFGAERDRRTNLAADVGAALDFTILPLIDIGIHGSYNVIAGNDETYDAFEWLQGGAHITFVLDRS